MALNKAELKQSIKAAFENQVSKTENPAAALDDLAGKIADAIDAYVKGASIYATPANVTSAAMIAGAYPVTAASNLTCNIA